MKRVGKLEGDFKKFTEFIKGSLVDMGNMIDEGNKSMESKIDDFSENIRKNNYDLGKIKEEKKTREKIIKWGFDALKQVLAIIVSILTIYLFLKYGGKIS